MRASNLGVGAFGNLSLKSVPQARGDFLRPSVEVLWILRMLLEQPSGAWHLFVIVFLFGFWGFVLAIMTHGFAMKLYLIKLLIENFYFGL